MTLGLQYTPAIDIWSIGCIFAEVLTGKALFQGNSIVHQLDLITDLLGTPSPDTISRIQNNKSRKYLTDMCKKRPVPFAEKFPNSDPLAICLLQKLLAFDPIDRPTAEQALADPYFKGLAKVEREPSSQSISELEFAFEGRKMTKVDIREIIYREILEYHPQLLKDHMAGKESINFLYPSAVGQFKTQFAYLVENGGKSGPVIPPARKHVSLPRSTVNSSTIPPKPQQCLAAFDNRRMPEEACNNIRVVDASGNFLKASRPPSRIPTGGAAPVLPYDISSRNVMGAYDARAYAQNPVLPLSRSPHYFFRTSTRNIENPVTEGKIDSSFIKQLHPQSMPGNVSPGITIDLNTNPYYQ